MTILVTSSCLLSAALSTPAAAAITKVPARTWGTNGRVTAILPVGDRIYVGGSFTAVVDPTGVSYPAPNLAVFSATTGAADLSFTAAPDGAVNALATDGVSTLYLGGAFRNVASGSSSVARNRVAAVDLTTGAVLSSWNVSASAQVDSLAYSPATNAVYIGGNFASLTGGSASAPHSYIAKVDRSSGTADTTFTTAPNQRIRALNVAADGSGRLFIGGEFTSLSGVGRSRFAAVSMATGIVDTTFQPGPNNASSYADVLDITSDASRVYVAVGGSGGACTAFPTTGGTRAWTDHANGNMQAVRLIGSTLYCGGHYDGTGSFAGQTRHKLASVNAATGAVMSGFAPTISSALGTWALGTQAGDPNLYLGGDFTTVSNVPQPHYAQFIDSSRQGPPQPPASLTAHPDQDSVTLSWSLPSSNGGSAITGYEIFTAGTSGGEQVDGPPLATLAATTTTYDDTSAVPGFASYYVVRARNALGTSGVSGEASATPIGIPANPPGPPTSVTATSPPGSVSLTWNPPNDNGGAPVTSYNVYRGTAPGAEDVTPYAQGITTTTFADGAVSAGTTYYYNVRAVNRAGEGAASSEVSTTAQPGVPDAPVLQAGFTGVAVDLSWTVPYDGGSPITKYVVLRDSVQLTRTSPPTTAYTDTTVASGETHQYQVKAVNAIGGGKLSTKLTVQIP